MTNKDSHASQRVDAAYPGDRSLTSTVCALHRIHWKRSMAANKSQIFMPFLLGFYALTAIAGCCVAAWAIIDSGGSIQALTVVAVAGLVSFAVLAVAMPAGEKQLTPQTLGVFPHPPAALLPGLALANLMTLRSGLSMVCSGLFAVAGSIVLWFTGHGAAIAPFILGVAVCCLTTLALADVLTVSGAAVGKDSRTRTKVLASLGVFALMLGLMQVNELIFVGAPLDAIGNIAAWTPLGAATGSALSLGQGLWLRGALQLLIAIATLAGLLWLWRVLTLRQCAEPVRSTGTRVETTGRGVSSLEFGRWSYSSPGRMEFTRCMRYLTRDSRMAASLLVLPIFLILMLWQIKNGEIGLARFYLLMFGVLAGLGASNDYGTDGPSYWSKFVAPVPASAFLRARHWALLLVPFVGLLLADALVVALSPGQRHVALAWAAIAVGVFLSSAGVSLLLTVFNPFPMSPPGANPWTDKSGYSGAAFLSAFVAFIGGAVPALPGILIAAFGSRSALWLGLGVVAGVALPAIFYALALRWASRHVDAHMPEIYAKVSRYVS